MHQTRKSEDVTVQILSHSEHKAGTAESEPICVQSPLLARMVKAVQRPQLL